MGPKGVLHVVHHKCGKVRGPKQNPLAPQLWRMFGLLQQANEALFSKVRRRDMHVWMFKHVRVGN